jgi:hypothetical protein
MAEQQSIAAGRLALEDATVQDFMASLRGEVLRPADEGYDDTRTIHNGMIDRRPTLIARCAGSLTSSRPSSSHAISSF